LAALRLAVRRAGFFAFEALLPREEAVFFLAVDFFVVRFAAEDFVLRFFAAFFATAIVFSLLVDDDSDYHGYSVRSTMMEDQSACQAHFA
jgi:hypothetical protein